MSAVQVLLVDDNPDFVQVAAEFLAADPDIEITGVATSGERALELADSYHPDLVIMDLAMPGMGGLEATRQLKARPNPPAVIILSLYSDEAYLEQARRAGADEEVSKSDLGVALLPLIRQMFNR
ncbi:MAG: response regulator transcription factor [Anaerolineae bacterium]|jgi:DNA-binding NarL/FixJ family response regulator